MNNKTRILFIVIMVLAAFAAVSCDSGAYAAKKSKKPPVSKPQKSKKEAKKTVVAYYFHSAARCITCKKIEAYSEESIKGAFADELKSGKLEWRVVNVEDKGNEHFINDFQLVTKSLVIVEMEGGKQKRWKNLDRIWELVRDKPAYMKYVQDEVRAYTGGKG